MNKTFFVYVLNKINQSGTSSIQHKDTIGVYHNETELDKQIDYFHKHNPSTKDFQYHFEIIKMPLDSIGEITYPVILK